MTRRVIYSYLLLSIIDRSVAVADRINKIKQCAKNKIYSITGNNRRKA